MSKFEILTLAVSIIATIAAIAAALYAGRALERATAANKIADASLRFQVLAPALAEYRSPEMYIAIRSLWEFLSQDPATLGQRFIDRREKDRAWLETLELAERVAFIQTTVDFHRRQVSQFYGLMAAIHEEGGHQRKWLYTYWRRRELKIIPKILIPLEHALAQALGEPAPKISLDRLKRLYDDCPS